MENLIRTAIEAALAGGREILAVYNSRHMRLKVEMRANLSPQTNADINSHLAIIAMLEKTELPILSEEGEDVAYEIRRNWERFWLVDPLDGTAGFLRRSGEFYVNTALIDHCRPVLGVIYAPISKKLYWGAENVGAYKYTFNEAFGSVEEIFKNGVQLPIACGPKSYWHVIGSRSLKAPDAHQFLPQQIADSRKECKVDVVNVGTSLKICRVAEGQADFYPCLEPSMEWNTAAGHAIANAAGKRITGLDGKTPLIYNKQQLVTPNFLVY
ncbi:MAG: 3'(2'),5'-bisphosphate nucleotidase CysQ [Mangrovibacterium sp.]